MADGKVPAIGGAAQVIQRPPDDGDLSAGRGPIELMVDAAREAAADAGAPALLASVDWVGVAGGLWRYHNPGQLVAERIGCPDAATARTAISGSAPQDMVGIAAERIARGDLDVALVLGGEARWSRARLKRNDEVPKWVNDPGEGDPEMLSGFAEEMVTEGITIGSAANAYALFDDSRRAALQESTSSHRDRLAQLWARFSAVAVDNPYAWDRSRHTAAEIREPTADNRMIAFPYTKAMVANNNVDMASAVLLCSADAARAAGVSGDRLVFPHVVTSSHETWKVINRDVLHSSSALAAAGAVAFEHVGAGPDDISHVDLYACFPAIVQMSAEALGFDADRPLTITGGLGFAGAPIGNAAGQSIAAMVPLVREGGLGLVHGNGGNATKHAIGIYANHPPAAFARIDAQDRADLNPRAELAEDWSGSGVVEAATVIFDRQGPSALLAAVRSATGERGWAKSNDEGLIEVAMSDQGLAGSSVHRATDGKITGVDARA